MRDRQSIGKDRALKQGARMAEKLKNELGARCWVLGVQYYVQDVG